MKKKLLFIHMGTLSADAGHTARLRYELDVLSKVADISIISLGGDIDTELAKRYSSVHFGTMPISFDGWNAVGVVSIAKEIAEYTRLFKVDLVVLCIEIWDLVVALKKLLNERVAFCVICHAMPFLATPRHPTGDYLCDIIRYLKEPLPSCRRDYISQHARELINVMQKGILVANNRTVAHYFHMYFPKGVFWEQTPFVTVSVQKKNNRERIDFDFCYMARMERGKGIEYLDEILRKISSILRRKISIAIMGRADDSFSKGILKDLIEEDGREAYTATFFGWADDRVKADVLGRSGCFLYPSHYDSFPTVVHEALSFGLPVALWDTLFYRLNYQGVESVRSAPCFKIDKFANMAVDLFKRRNELIDFSVDFIKKMSGSGRVAESDMALFKNIIKYHERNKK